MSSIQASLVYRTRFRTAMTTLRDPFSKQASKLGGGGARRQREADLCELEASLVDGASARTGSKAASINKNKTKKQTNKK